MKTTKLLTLAIAASCALGASALADQQVGHPAHSPEKMAKKGDSGKTWDAQPTAIRTIGYPVVFLGRAGHSILRSPEIVSETFKGQRTIVSKKGLFARSDMGQPGQRVASAPAQSVTNRRG
jgi:hypothetical protein